ncbi:MAG: acyl carrier protein [Paracoccaceae bacterium]
MAPTVDDQVIAILARQAVLDPRDVTSEMSPDDLGLDSLGLVEAIFAFEETFDISVPFNANQPGSGQFDLSSVGAIIAAVKALIAQKA